MQFVISEVQLAILCYSTYADMGLDVAALSIAAQGGTNISHVVGSPDAAEGLLSIPASVVAAADSAAVSDE